MNNLGFSKDSVNIGDFRIKGQGETLIIGNENGGDGYILPTEKGTILGSLMINRFAADTLDSDSLELIYHNNLLTLYVLCVALY